MGAFLGQRATGNVFPGTHKAIEIIWGECFTKRQKRASLQNFGLRQAAAALGHDLSSSAG